MFLKKLAHFWVTGKHFPRPCAKLISNISKKNFGFWVLKQFGKTSQMLNFLSLKNHSTLFPNHPTIRGMMDRQFYQVYSGLYNPSSVYHHHPPPLPECRTQARTFSSMVSNNQCLIYNILSGLLRSYNPSSVGWSDFFFWSGRRRHLLTKGQAWF